MLNILRSNFMVKFRPSVVDIFHSWHEWLTDWQTWSSSMTKKYIYDIILNDHSILNPIKLHYSDVTKLSYPLCLVNISKTRLFSVTSHWCDVDVTFSCVFSSVLSDSSRFSSPSCPRVFPATVIVCSALMCCTCVHYPLLLLLLLLKCFWPCFWILCLLPCPCDLFVWSSWMSCVPTFFWQVTSILRKTLNRVWVVVLGSSLSVCVLSFISEKTVLCLALWRCIFR